MMDRNEVRFGQFRLDLRQRKLTRDGEPVQVGSRALDILCVLASANGEVVSKDDLMARVWPGVVVEENNIQVHVSALRKALEEGKSGKICLVTVPGRGYRLLGVELAPMAVFGDSTTRQNPPLPDRPSIAVLPFQNMSGDIEQEYFADGVVEEIITALSRFSSLFVIARNSSFTYKGRAVDVKQVGRELGVRYVLEGSIRKSANRIRITGQLIDAIDGTHLWADRFDGALEDMLDLQDHLTANVVNAIAPKLEQIEIVRAKRKPTESLGAYDFFLRGLASVYRATRESIDEALRLFGKATELDPEFAAAYGWGAFCYTFRKTNSWMTDREREIADATRLSWKAVESGKDDAVPLARGGHTLAYVVGDVNAGTIFIDRARTLNPNYSTAWLSSGWLRVWIGEPDIAVEHFTRFKRMSPLDPLMPDAMSGCAFAHFHAGRYAEAALVIEQALQETQNLRTVNLHTALRVSVASNMLAGRIEQAHASLARLRQIDPALRVSNLDKLTWRRRPEDMAQYLDAMRKAGLPE
jgi:TolB-like protein